jgi:hypothetical protein
MTQRAIGMVDLGMFRHLVILFESNGFYAATAPFLV